MRGQRRRICTHASGLLRALSPHELMPFKKYTHPRLKLKAVIGQKSETGRMKCKDSDILDLIYENV